MSGLNACARCYHKVRAELVFSLNCVSESSEMQFNQHNHLLRFSAFSEAKFHSKADCYGPNSAIGLPKLVCTYIDNFL